jgi:hypothetical protein
VLPKAIAKVRIWWLNLLRAEIWGTKELKSWQEINSSYLMAEKEWWIWERLLVDLLLESRNAKLRVPI